MCSHFCNICVSVVKRDRYRSYRSKQALLTWSEEVLLISFKSASLGHLKPTDYRSRSEEQMLLFQHLLQIRSCFLELRVKNRFPLTLASETDLFFFLKVWYLSEATIFSGCSLVFAHCRQIFYLTFLLDISLWVAVSSVLCSIIHSFCKFSIIVPEICNCMVHSLEYQTMTCAKVHSQA